MKRTTSTRNRDVNHAKKGCWKFIEITLSRYYVTLQVGVKNSKKEVSDVRFEGVCSPDGYSQAPRDGFMVSLKADI